ncbi:MAG: stage III sporulation protein AE [Firmicutes bacterium]|nr:stage III sporulation protein AE [Bacillota bacterium]
MKKIFLLLFLFSLWAWPSSGLALTADSQPAASAQILEQQIQKLDFSQVEKVINEIDREMGNYLPKFSFRQMIDDLKNGRFSWDLKTVLAGIGKYFIEELIANSALLGKLVVLAVVCAVLQNLQSAFDKGTTGKFAHAACYLVLFTIALGSFSLAVGIGREAIDRMVGFVLALLPILLTLLVAVGGMTSAAVFHPFIMGSLSVISVILKNVIFPLIFFGAILSIVSQLSERFKVSRLAGLFKELSVICIGLMLTIFIGILTIQGAIGSVADSVTLRTAKFATDTFVPVVGGIFSDALETVVSYSLLLKNAVGIVGLVIIFLLCTFPVLKIFAITLVYKIAAALVQPLGDAQIAEALETMGSYLVLVFAVVSGVGLMFFVAITIIIGTANLTVMLR